MVLINIESLSENELRYIAKQEDLEDWETLSRDELIEALEEFYEEEDDNLQTSSGSSKRKFVNTLTDVKSQNLLSLPGTASLPDFYNETSIHMIMKDFNWAYVFWSISTQQARILEGENASLLLRTRRISSDGEEEAVYDISVSLSDSYWTVELPYLGYTYQVSLVAVTAGEENEICRSTRLTTTRSWFSKHPEELHDDVTFRMIFSSLILKGGRLFTNRQMCGLLEGLDCSSENGEEKE